MEKIDVFNTLTEMSKCLRSDEAAENTPFILLAAREEDNKAAVSICSNSKSAIELYAALTQSLTESLKDNFSEKAILKLFTGIVMKSVAKVFAEEKYNEIKGFIDFLKSVKGETDSEDLSADDFDFDADDLDEVS